MKQKIKQLPKGWEEKKLGDILDYEQPNKYIVKSPILDKGEIPVLTANKSFIKGYTNEKENIFEDIPAIIFDDFTTDNKFVNFPFKVKSSAMKILKLKNKDNSLKFIYYQMNVKKVNHTTHKRYYLSTYQNLDFLIPSPEIQQKIVQAIETQFSRLDEAIENLKSVKKKIKTYKQSILKKAFEKKEGWEENKISGQKIKRIPLSELVEPKKGKKVKVIKNKTPNSVPYLLIDTLRGKEPSFFTEDKKYTEAIPEDILIVGDGANSGLVGTRLKGAVGSTIIRLRKKVKDLDNSYLTYFLNLYFEQLRSETKGTGIPHLRTNKLLEMKLRKPAVKEQQKIVQEIESKFSVIDKLEQIVEQSLEKAERLRKSILKVAFEGRLVK